MRLQIIRPEYPRIRLRLKYVPLEIINREPVPRDIIDQEWALAALQEPQAEFKGWEAPDYPTTTLPTAEAAKCAALQGYEEGLRYDLALRNAFFFESQNISLRQVLLDIAAKVGLDVGRLKKDLDSGRLRGEVLAEERYAWEELQIEGSPTLVLPSGRKYFAPGMSHPEWRNRRVYRTRPLLWHGEERLNVYRRIFEEVLAA